VVLLDLPGGGTLADTPGFNYPSLQQVTAASMQSHFPEISRIRGAAPCAFANCTHEHEPGCAVRETPWERYEFYVRWGARGLGGEGSRVRIEKARCCSKLELLPFTSHCLCRLCREQAHVRSATPPKPFHLQPLHCPRLLEEVRERESHENTTMQMQKRRRQGMVKRRQATGGADVEVARLDAKKHRRVTRGARKLGVKTALEHAADDGEV